MSAGESRPAKLSSTLFDRDAVLRTERAWAALESGTLIAPGTTLVAKAAVAVKKEGGNNPEKAPTVIVKGPRETV